MSRTQQVKPAAPPPTYDEGVGNKCRLALTERGIILDIMDLNDKGTIEWDRIESFALYMCQGVVMIPSKG